MQKELDADYPELDIHIVGMNPIAHESGNTLITTGRDIPWLQDRDDNGDNVSDVWLTSWPFVYRDVVIVDTENIPVDAYNLTTNTLEDEESYDELRQRLIDVAFGAITPIDDTAIASVSSAIEIAVLDNDQGSSRVDLIDVSQPSSGTASVTTIEYPSDLSPISKKLPPLVISEIVPGEYIELFNTEYREVDLSVQSQRLVTGTSEFSVGSLADGQTIAARGYKQLAWPAEFTPTTRADSGELVLFRSDTFGFDNPALMDDFVAWGTTIPNTRIELARQVGKWTGAPDGPMDEGAIQRIPSTEGIEEHAYDNHRPSTPGQAINNTIESMQIVKYESNAGFSGVDSFSYSVRDRQGTTKQAVVNVTVRPNANRWQNPGDALDVNDDGDVELDDAELIIKAINQGFKGPILDSVSAPWLPTFIDCDGNGSIEPIDVLLIANAVNSRVVSSVPLPAVAGLEISDVDNLSDVAAAVLNIEPSNNQNRISKAAEIEQS